MTIHPCPPNLIEAARAASARAYAPYSKFHVGAAVAAGGKIFAGCNVENASYGLTTCAERNAVAAAVAGGETGLEAIAIFAPTAKPTPPCGACRQVLAEFNPEMPVHLIAADGSVETLNLADLLPRRFGLRP
jgi:cytidine deaminase